MAKAKADKPKTPRKRTPRPKQSYIPGTAPLSVPEIDKVADEYRDCRDTRMAELAKEVEAQEKLLQLMHKHNLQSYEYDGYIVKLNPVEKVSVKRKPGANGKED